MSRNSKKANILLWTAQIILALLFAFAGVMKLILPLSALQQGPIALPGEFLRFIGVAETLGALGLILPGLFRIKLHLTPLAAAGLVVIMAGATTVTAMSGSWTGALVPLVTGALSLAVCLGRGGKVMVLGHRPVGHLSLQSN